MEGVFRFNSWFLNTPGLIHGGAYYRNFTVCYVTKPFLQHEATEEQNLKYKF